MHVLRSRVLRITATSNKIHSPMEFVITEFDARAHVCVRVCVCACVCVCVYIYIYACVCVCVCVCERERDNDTEMDLGETVCVKV
jgi:hypothetical protein